MSSCSIIFSLGLLVYLLPIAYLADLNPIPSFPLNIYVSYTSIRSCPFTISSVSSFGIPSIHSHTIASPKPCCKPYLFNTLPYSLTPRLMFTALSPYIIGLTTNASLSSLSGSLSAWNQSILPFISRLYKLSTVNGLLF